QRRRWRRRGSAVAGHCRSGGSREPLLPPLRRQGGRKAVCEPLARGLTNAIELCSMAGRDGEGLRGPKRCLRWVAPAPTQPPPGLPLPSQGEGQDQELAASAAPTKARRAARGSAPPVLARRAVAADQAQGLDADLDVALDVLRAHLRVRSLCLDPFRDHRLV